MPKTLTKNEFFEKYKDPRWQKKRLEILERDNFCCQDCGSKVDHLHIHHMYYEKGLNPWEYSDESLITLCENCHKEIYNNQLKLQKLIAKLGPYFLDMIIGICYGLLFAYDDNYYNNKKIKIENYPMAEGIYYIWGILPKKLINSLKKGILDYKLLIKLSKETTKNE